MDQTETPIVNESRDGVGSADHDQPYTFGNHVSSKMLFPFTYREYVRLQLTRGLFENRSADDMRDAA